jgi:hypothetical protein
MRMLATAFAVALSCPAHAALTEEGMDCAPAFAAVTQMNERGYLVAMQVQKEDLVVLGIVQPGMPVKVYHITWNRRHSRRIACRKDK